MIKRPVVIITAILVLIIAVVFIYRYQIMQYTAEKLIRKLLPSYVKVDTIRFDFGKGDVILTRFKVLNPPAFSKEYLLEVEKIVCHYKLNGKTIFDGLEVSNPVLTNTTLDIERLGDGRLNLIEAGAMIGKGSKPSASKEPVANMAKESAPGTLSENKRMGGALKLPENCVIKDARIVFMDRLTGPMPNIITFDNINTEVTFKMDEHYTKVLYAASTGTGNVNADKDQVIKWVITLDPTTPRFTMSNRFDVSNVLIMPFEPYYDKYSPLVFKSGRFSGLLIFDFNNGNIGSTDELRLSDLKFFVKPGYENAQFWETTVPDLVKYFTTPYGEVIFDFKIKGDMNKPQFYQGPRSKEAIFAMAVDKVSAAIQKAQGGGGGAAKNDIGKAKEYIDFFKGMMKK